MVAVGDGASVFAASLIAHWGPDEALHIWSQAELDTLLAINTFAVASLTAFIAIRYAGVEPRSKPGGSRSDDETLLLE